MQLNSKVINKWQSSPISTSTSLFSGLFPLSSKIFCTPHQVTQFLEGPTPFNKWGGVPTMFYRCVNQLLIMRSDYVGYIMGAAVAHLNSALIKYFVKLVGE